MSSINLKFQEQFKATIAFYNLENLFDTVDDKNTLDDDFLPESKKCWDAKKYHIKLEKISEVILKIGKESSKIPPIFIGVVEVENKSVLQDLVTQTKLSKYEYDFVHYDSPDERGIDVAFMYQKKHFELLNSETFTLWITNNKGKRDYTRDILLVKGKIKEEIIYVIVNHWPSRRDGASKTSYKRIRAANLVGEIIDKIKQKEESPKIIVMGDFNDNPNSTSIKQLIAHNNLYNPMLPIYSKGIGSAIHKGKWYLFDQLIFTKNFLNPEDSSLSFNFSKIFDDDIVKEWHGVYKGNPYRTFVGKKYLGGVSDHFPVYAVLTIK